MAQWLAPWLRKWVTRVQFPFPLISFHVTLSDWLSSVPVRWKGGQCFDNRAL